MGVQLEQHDGTVTLPLWDGDGCALSSGMAPNVVFWPEESFTASSSTLVNVPTPEIIDAAYMGDPAIQLVPTRSMVVHKMKDRARDQSRIEQCPSLYDKYCDVTDAAKPREVLPYASK
jgi:hypothetical protein